MPTALVRRPSSKLAEGLVTHIARQPVDVTVAEGQWRGYVQALVDCGWATVDVRPADECPDSVFVEDAVVVFGPLAVITRPGAPSRRPEIDDVPDALAGLNMDTARIEAAGTLDGGDVLKVVPEARGLRHLPVRAAAPHVTLGPSPAELRQRCSPGEGLVGRHPGPGQP